MASRPTYLFYDLETSGLNKAFDQVFEFAAIRTDLEFNEIERYHVEIALMRDVVPSPAALITHRIPFEQLLAGQSEDVAMAEIHRILNVPATLSGGYNTLGFDDEFLRFSFYRNLLSVYTHQYANGCGRFDLYPLTMLYALYQPNSLQWPQRDDGQLSLKLEPLNAANQWIADGQAHRAMTDVEVTVELAKALAAQPEMWQYAMGYFQKPIEQARIAKLAYSEQIDLPVALYVSGKLGVKQGFQCPVLGLGQHQQYKNQSVWLRLDRPEFQQMTVDDFVESAWVIRKKLAEPGFLLPLQGHCQAQLGDERRELAQENLAWLASQPDLLSALQTHYCQYVYPVVEHVDIDAALYQVGFRDRADEALCREFHITPIEKRASLINRLHSPGLQAQAWRVLWRHHPQYLTEAGQTALAEYQHNLAADKVFDFREQPRFNRVQALQDIERLRTEGGLDEQQSAILVALQTHLSQQVETMS